VVTWITVDRSQKPSGWSCGIEPTSKEVLEMGFGKGKKDDIVLGRLKVEPWEREPLTEIQPLRGNAAPPSELSEGTVKGAGEQDTK
jgi:hypothetical protein